MASYLREEIEDEYGIKDLQECILGIMVYLDEFCEDNKIDYCLMAGSALGARRHEGFIPWDDDMDIYMSPDDYSRFRKLFMEKGDSRYYLQEWGKCNIKGETRVTMAKVRLNGSVLQEEAFKGWKMHQGVFVDIFIIHNAPHSAILRRSQHFLGELVVLKGLANRCYTATSLKKKVKLCIGRVLPTKLVLRIGMKTLFTDKKTEWLSGFIDTRRYARAVYPRDTIFPTRYVKFENVYLRVPNRLDEYLRIQFGEDYLTPPPVEKRPLKKHAAFWKIDSSIRYSELDDENRLI